MVKTEEYVEEELSGSGKTSCNEEDDDLFNSDWPQDRRGSSVDTKSHVNGKDHGTPGPLSGGKLGGNADISPSDDRRMRRQIANCNERRRMQSINAGFQALRHLLPRKDGEKLSKAAILQQTADFVHNLLAEKERQMLDGGCLAAKKRRMQERDCPDITDATDAPIRPNGEQADIAQYLRTIDELRGALSKEQQLRMAYEQELVEIRRYAASLGLSQNMPVTAALAALLSGSTAQLGNPFNRPEGTNPLLLNRPYPDLSSLALATQGAASAYLLSSALNLAPVQNAANSPNVTYHQLQPMLAKPQPTVSETPTVERSASAWPAMADGVSGRSFAPTMTSSSDSVASATLRDALAAHNASDPGSVAQRNLQAILDAIRHIEGGVRPSSAPHQTDVMVR